MALLTIPNWSFGRDKRLLRTFRELIDERDVTLHYCESDLDHNRTVTAFSGEPSELVQCILDLAEAAFSKIDLNKHVGVHPRIGALDVCPFVVLENDQTIESLQIALETVHVLAKMLASKYEVPVFLYEKSEQGRHEADLPSLRRGGFGALLERELRPDYGPPQAHGLLGATVMGVREALLAVNANLKTEELLIAKELAAEIRHLRQEGDQRFLGVRALGLPLPSRQLTQVSLNLTLPDLTYVDPVIEWVSDQAAARNVQLDSTELIGVIRHKDLPGATRLPVKQEQIVDE
jgi:glutamate formiminotransferase